MNHSLQTLGTVQQEIEEIQRWQTEDSRMPQPNQVWG